MARPNDGNPEGIVWAHNPPDFPLGLPSNTKGTAAMPNTSDRRRGKDGRFLPGKARGSGGGGSRGAASRASSGSGSRGGSSSRSSSSRSTSSRGQKNGAERAPAQRASAPRGGGAKNARSTALAPRPRSAPAVQNPPRGGESTGQILATGLLASFLMSLKMRALEGAGAVVDAGSDIALGLGLRTDTASKAPVVGEYAHLAGNFFLYLGVFKGVRIIAGSWVDKAANAVPMPKLLNTDKAEEEKEITDDPNVGEYVNIPGVGFDGYPDLAEVNSWLS